MSRRSSLSGGVIAGVALLVALAAQANVGFSSGNPDVSKVYVNASNKGGAVELLNSSQSWVVNANSTWTVGGVARQVRRFNRAIVRWPALWTSTSIAFEAIVTPQVFSDGQFAIVVDGAVAATYTGIGDGLPRYVSITGLPIAGGGSTVEIWEPWSGKPGSQNTGADGPVEAGYVTAAYLAPGQTITRPTATTGIVVVGDSIVGAVLSSHPEVMGVVGQLRLLAEAKGWLLSSLDYGGATLRGDGYTPAQLVTLIQAAVTSMGSPSTVYVLIAYGHNDYADYGATVSSTPTQIATDTQTVVSGLSAGWTKVVVTVWPATSSGANGGGFTLANYQTQQATVTGATIVDSTTCGIVTGTDLADGVHFNAGGVTKAVACVKGSVGL